MRLDLTRLKEIWAEKWPEPPIAHNFKVTFSDKWVRLHALPESKRYPDNEAEYKEILSRHNTVLKWLAPQQRILLITCSWGEHDKPEPADFAAAQVLNPGSTQWQAIEGEPGEAEYTHLYILSLIHI